MASEAPEFEWDDANRDHIALHNVTPDEAQQAILDPDSVLVAIQSGDEEERTKALGITFGGRILVVVFTFRGAAIRPVTAYAAAPRLQELYLRRRAK